MPSAGWRASPTARFPPAPRSRRSCARSVPNCPTVPSTPADVVDLLATACEPGLTAFPSGRFYGFVIGGTRTGRAGRGLAGQRLGPELRDARRLARVHGGRRTSPAPGCSTCSACRATAPSASPRVPRWRTSPASPPGATRCCGAPAGTSPATDSRAGRAVRVVAGEDRHMAIDLALRYLGLGTPTLVEADDQGRIEPDALRRGLAAGGRSPTIVVLQAGDIHSGAFDPFAETIRAAREADAWVHIDGAFGLWAAASPRARTPDGGLRGRRLLGDGRPQDPERPLRLRPRHRARPGRRSGRRWACTATTSSSTNTGDPARQGARTLPARPGLHRVGGAQVPRPIGRGRPRRPAVPSRLRVCRRHRRRSTARQSSTTWCSPRSAPSSAATNARNGCSPGCSTTARPGSAAPPGTAGASCGSR